MKVSSDPAGASQLGTVECPVHGIVTPLARPHAVDIEGLREVSELVPERSIYLPWPMSPGWSIADFGCVAASDSATFSVTVGTTIPDGRVEVSVISEDPGVGVGARCAGLAGVDPGRQLGVELGANGLPRTFASTHERCRCGSSAISTRMLIRSRPPPSLARPMGAGSGW